MSHSDEPPPAPSLEEVRDMLSTIALNQISLASVMVRLIGIQDVNTIGGNRENTITMIDKINEVFKDTESILDRLLGKA